MSTDWLIAACSAEMRKKVNVLSSLISSGARCHGKRRHALGIVGHGKAGISGRNTP